MGLFCLCFHRFYDEPVIVSVIVTAALSIMNFQASVNHFTNTAILISASLADRIVTRVAIVSSILLMVADLLVSFDKQGYGS